MHSSCAKPESHAPNHDCKHVCKAKQFYWRFTEGCAKLSGSRPSAAWRWLSVKAADTVAISVTLCPLTSVLQGGKKCEGGDPAIWNSVSLTGRMKLCLFLCSKELQPWKLKVARDFQNFACVHRAARNSINNSVVWKGCSYNFKKTVLLVEQLTKSCWYAPARCLLWKMTFECCFPSKA